MLFFKREKPYTTKFTDATRPRGSSESCPYCGSFHATDREFSACARQHSYSSATYDCPRCGRPHLTLDAANHCCEDEKRFERRYDPATYDRYAYDHDYDYNYNHPAPPPSQPRTSLIGSFFDSYLDFGGQSSSRARESQPSGGIFDSFLNFGSSESSHRDQSSASSSGSIFDAFANFGSGGSSGNSGNSDSNNSGGWFF